MFGMSMTEMIIIAVFALLVLGPKELPNVAKTVGKTLRDFRRAGDDLKETFEREIMQDKPAPKIRPVVDAVAQVPAAPVPGAEPAPGLPSAAPVNADPVAAAEPPAPATGPDKV